MKLNISRRWLELCETQLQIAAAYYLARDP